MQESFELIKSQQPGLTLFQFEKYWTWYWEITSPLYSYLSKKQAFSLWMKECASGKPLGHILGQWAFYQDIFFVNNATLIPRPETELMVDHALATVTRPMNVLEIGVGSGAVILSLMLHSKFHLNCTATDISPAALELCQKNYDAKSLRLKHHTFELRCTDRTTNMAPNSYDLILCNPPYIPEYHTGVSKQVNQFEPALALYLAQDDYERWMLELLHGISNCLTPTGIAIIEGHEDKLYDLKNLIKKNVQITILNDLNQRPRFLLLQKVPQ